MDWTEQWKPVFGFEKYYEVSNLGRVRSITAVKPHGGFRSRKWNGRILKTSPPKNGRYRKITLYGDGIVKEIRLHVLVASNWIPNPLGLTLVCHRDDDKANNSVSNLYWGTQDTNAQDRAILGSSAKKLTPNQVKEIKKILSDPHRQITLKKLASDFGIKPCTIRSIRAERTWKYVSP